ncbi:hypothetical protein Dda_4847 [Drechslerella dactyloides]|uniref:Uncharacterized protein n=1 Tax=Drechslerella dactyloides TaxID=74499 RepID=A0AAD6NIB3_DREDA|nr:hypothetical protein Dda_4847 [Drechslerella dactyloides]
MQAADTTDWTLVSPCMRPGGGGGDAVLALLQPASNKEWLVELELRMAGWTKKSFPARGRTRRNENPENQMSRSQAAAAASKRRRRKPSEEEEEERRDRRWPTMHRRPDDDVVPAGLPRMQCLLLRLQPVI